VIGVCLGSGAVWGIKRGDVEMWGCGGGLGSRLVVARRDGLEVGETAGRSLCERMVWALERGREGAERL
jgi:hypothetical protein